MRDCWRSTIRGFRLSAFGSRVTVHGSRVPGHRFFLAVLCIAISGCSQSYASERLFWRAKHLQAAIAENPAKAGQEEINRVIAAFERVTQETPATVWAARAKAAIGALYASREQYSKARKTYRALAETYNGYENISLQALEAVARSYALEQDWDHVASTYKDIMSSHPWSAAGLEAPLYIARLYKTLEQPKRMETAWKQAAQIYTKRIEDAPTQALETQARGYLAMAYQNLNQWDKSLKILEDFMQSEDEAINRPLVLLTIGMIYDQKVDKPEAAKKAYTALVREFPDHPFSEVAGAQLKRLEGRSGAPSAVSNKQ